MNGTRFGAELTETGVIFRLWAPGANSVDLVLDSPLRMHARPGGWYELAVTGARAGTLYKFRIDDEIDVPDPASHFQPSDVSGPSEVIAHEQYRWQTPEWLGRPWQDAAFLELHIGTFTPSGSFRAAIEKLDHVRDTGVTAIELMPVADFSGRRNWGYDGVLLYAPDSAYGRPDDLKALIDEAHRRGLMVFLDVVYNHFGPEGNYLHRYAPGFFTDAHTPWGSAIDYRVPQVRSFVVENALHWLRHYRFDGLRLDAVHAIVQPGEPSVLQELSRAVGALAKSTGRIIHLVLENDDNRAALLDPRTDPPQGKFRAQWNDDYHHAWHVLLTGEHRGYYQDYAPDSRRHIARALSSGFAYQGEASPHREGRRRGEPSGGLPPTAFVNFLQNHDQIGNRARGDRLSAQVNDRAMAAALTIMLLAPMPPLLFMGEEWGSKRPFPFFCDFSGELADAVRKGRRKEFKSEYAELGDEIPDPLDEATFRSAILDWDARETGSGTVRLDLVRKLLTVRRKEIAPRLDGASFGSADWHDNVLIAQWMLGDKTGLHLAANLSDQAVPRPRDLPDGRPIWGDAAATVPSWSVVWTLGAR